MPETFPKPAVDTSHADARTARVLLDYFDAKNRHDPVATMPFFSPDLAGYVDTTLGWVAPGYDGQQKLLSEYMPRWGEGRSHPVRILAGAKSALVSFNDTPELFGDEIHVLGAVDLRDGRIARWADYWDSTA